MLQKLLLLICLLPLAARAEIPWKSLSEKLGPGVLREIGSVEEVFQECAMAIEAYGGALLPTVANGTCSFAGVCVFEDCGVLESASGSGSGDFVEDPDLCPPSMADCATAGPCFDHDMGICQDDGTMFTEGEAAGCATAVPFCNGCFPNSRCGGLATSGAPRDDSGVFVESNVCTSDFAGCADAAICFDHALGLCGEDGVITSPDCAPAVPGCNPCFPNSRCGGLATESEPVSEPVADPGVPDGSGVFVESEVCTSDFAGCADAAICFDHALGVCGEDGVITSPECAPAVPACNACFPNSRCGGLATESSGEDEGGLFVESEACPAAFAGCADAAICFDHTSGICGEDGVNSLPDCAEALQSCSVCFPNSRCSGGEVAAPSAPTLPSDFNTSPKLPVYSVVATTLEHVQTTVAFAAENKIPLSIKTTGASYSNANQYNDNLLLSMREFPMHSGGVDAPAKISRVGGDSLMSATITDMAGIMENYVDACGNEYGPAIEIGGGETWGDVFGSLATYNSNRGEGQTKYMLSSGAAVTVGASGGWLMGGGLGPFDRSMGLGIDNVVAYKVVTAPNGVVVVADKCNPETSDLFWALRGGGGGNFGVIVSQISKLHPIKPLIRANVIWMGAPGVKAVTDQMPEGMTLSGDMIPDNLAKGSIGTRQNNIEWTKPSADAEIAPMEQLDMWWDTMLTVLNPVTMDPNIDGYYGIGCAWAGGYMCADLYFLGSMDEFESAVLAPLRESLGITAMPDAPATETGPGAAGVGANFIYIAQEYEDGYYSYASQDCVSATEGSPQAFVCDDLGYPSANGYNTDSQVNQGGYETRLSWMIPDWLFGTGTAGNPPDDAVAERAKALFSEDLMLGVTGHVLGGNVNAVSADETSTSPVMRSSALEGLFPFLMIKGLGVQQSVDVLTKHLPAPDSVPIFNHDALNLDLLERLGAPQNLSWQELYWGENLPKLQEIKAKYDAQNVFQCRDCLTVDGGDSEVESNTGDVVGDTSSPAPRPTSTMWYFAAIVISVGNVLLL